MSTSGPRQTSKRFSPLHVVKQHGSQLNVEHSYHGRGVPPAEQQCRGTIVWAQSVVCRGSPPKEKDNQAKGEGSKAQEANKVMVKRIGHPVGRRTAVRSLMAVGAHRVIGDARIVFFIACNRPAGANKRKEVRTHAKKIAIFCGIISSCYHIRGIKGTGCALRGLKPQSIKQGSILRGGIWASGP